MKRRPYRLALVALASLTLWVSPLSLSAQPNLDEISIEAIEVAEGLYMLTGYGGNLGVSIGEDGVFLIDDQYAPLTDKIKAAIAELSGDPIRFVLNTHWHGDHTGGNENLGKAGVMIVAHENVRQRMSVEQFIEIFGSKTPPSPEVALPVITYTDEVTFYLNGEQIHAFHVPPAHTDGDSIVHFKNADVIHMGDLYFEGMYPFIDVWSGGSVDGYIAAVERVLAMADEDTKIIPGHGPLADRSDLVDFLAMLRTVRAKVGALVDAGKTLEETLAAKPTAEFDEALGGGFLNPETFTAIVYRGLSGDL